MKAEEVPADVKAAYLSNDNSRTEIDGVPAIGKFKKPELIYKDILALYAERGTGKSGYRKNADSRCDMLLFQSFAGGTGASTVAVAAAVHFARTGEKVLYLNLETTGSSASFFRGEGNYSFEDVIYALKSKKTDLYLKMESSVRRDANGVYYFAPCKMAMFMLEMADEDIMEILTTLKNTSDYTKIMIDMDFALTDRCMNVMDYVDKIILVNDGTDIANTKVIRTLRALEIMEEQKQIRVLDHMSMVYNKFSSSKSSNEIGQTAVPVVGKIPPVKHASVHEIMQIMLTKPEIFERLR
ncbi:AAA family ATPase [Clostridium sp. AM58-1XD]|uniref:nucleotide-binding protein n=1 Tax=Clostridium sp. AM58-1XD TaxID=2292307 RepID=UPI000E47D36D|nr:AAA family ATPase [Clostridium sp. AM58-1XD]RGZ01875.1 hypothetical protein DXA13_00810 [Clostridium sp. AM58-1XD]